MPKRKAKAAKIPVPEVEDEEPKEERDADAEEALKDPEDEEPDEEEVKEAKLREGKKAKKAKKVKKTDAEDAEAEEEEEDDDDDDDEADDEDDFVTKDMKKMTKKKLCVTLTRVNGSLGIAMSGNVVSAVHAGGGGDKAGLAVGDYVNEVNGYDTHLSSFGSLLPKDKESPVKMRLTRMVEWTPSKCSPQAGAEESVTAA